MSVDPAPSSARPGSLFSELRGEAPAARQATLSAFWRMVGLMRPHWRPMTLGLILSFGVALTYAASLLGMLPILKVIIEQENLQTYLYESTEGLREAGAPKAWAAPLVGLLAAWVPGPDVPDAAFKTLVVMVVILVGVNALGNVFRFFSQYLVLLACNRTIMDIRRHMYRKALKLPLSRMTGDVSGTISQFVSDVREVYLGIVTLFGKVAREPLKAICVFGVALAVDYRLTLVMVAIAPFAIGILWFFGRKVRKAMVRLLRGYGHMLVGLEETLQGLDVVKGYAREGYERRRMWGIERRMFKQQMKLAVIEALSSPLIEVIGLGIAAAGIVWLGGKVLVGEMSPEQFFLMVALLAAMLDPIRKVANVYNMVQRAGAASQRIFETLDHAEERSPHPALPFPATGAPPIRFEDITFRYVPDADPALQDLTLDVAAGECIALVGPNGSGKTTLVRLLPRLLTPEAGRVLIGGVPADQLSLRELRKRIAAVTQHPIIFARSVRENIAYGNPNASLEAVREAARLAHADEFIERWPQQYDTVLGEGGMTMSGGQRQRIAIARAFLKEASIVIFDEATSQIDAESEAKIHDALGVLVQDKTSLLIAHRHTVMDLAHRIVVLDNGRVVDHGSRAELLERCPLFMALYRAPLR